MCVCVSVTKDVQCVCVFVSVSMYVCLSVTKDVQDGDLALQAFSGTWEMGEVFESRGRNLGDIQSRSPGTKVEG